MKRHRTHQIDGLAQGVLQDALPPSWVLNAQTKDYGKDYLVEIGDADDKLTGSSFYIQLKGQERAAVSADGKWVKYSLETKYAEYYLDKVKDLPVFLVVVDVSKRTGRWLFLQSVLDADLSWRSRGSVTLRLPIDNSIKDTPRLQMAVTKAKTWMRLHHPESIHESVVAHKQKIILADPRFDVDVSLINDHPSFALLAKKDVSLTLTFKGDPDHTSKRLEELLDKGGVMTFEPGEVQTAGSKLFDELGFGLSAIHATNTCAGEVTFICRDADGSEVARLNDVPGHLSGGLKERWFKGGLPGSPLTVTLGPIAAKMNGSVQLTSNPHCWDGQPLDQLAYFNHLHRFFRGLVSSTSTIVECYRAGNLVFSVPVALHKQAFAGQLANFLESVSKARKVAQRLSLNPTWTVDKFDRETQETADELHAVFFEDGWSGPMPNIQLTTTCERKKAPLDALRELTQPTSLQLTTGRTYSFLGESIDVRNLVHDCTEVTVALEDSSTPSPVGGLIQGRKTMKPGDKEFTADTVDLLVVGTEATVMSVRLASSEDGSL